LGWRHVIEFILECNRWTPEEPESGDRKTGSARQSIEAFAIYHFQWRPLPAAVLPSKLWITWLLAVSAGVIAFGLVLVCAPSLARQGFSLLLYATPNRLDSFGNEQVSYISLTHAVIGGIMVGWGTTLFSVTKTLLSRGKRIGWNIICLSVVAWFVPDTAYSLLSGFWQNALLNTAFLTLFAIPLWATHGLPD
jgi:hypothetical protein